MNGRLRIKNLSLYVLNARNRRDIDKYIIIKTSTINNRKYKSILISTKHLNS